MATAAKGCRDHRIPGCTRDLIAEAKASYPTLALPAGGVMAAMRRRAVLGTIATMLFAGLCQATSEISHVA
jgi:hypothetical protein